MIEKIIKIAITGPESTGKSTLAAALAQYFHTVYVPEFARIYLNGLNRAYNEKDLLIIAQGQMSLESEYLKKAKNGILFCDTEMYVMKIWSQHAYQRVHPWIEKSLQQQDYDFYFLMDIDIPWSPDPLREHPQPHMRTYFFNWYQQLLTEDKMPFCILSGNVEERLQKAIEVLKVQKLLR